MTLFCHPWCQLLFSPLSPWSSSVFLSSLLYCLSFLISSRLPFLCLCFVALTGSSGSWCERRSSAPAPVWCSCWSSGGPRSAAAEPGRRSPAAGTPPPRHCSLEHEHTETRRRLKKRNVTACLNSYCKTTYCPFKDELWSETTALAVGQRASNKQHEQI